MPRLIVTPGAARGIERARRFLRDKDLSAAERAGRVILDRLKALQAFPEIGRPFDEDADLRELVIPFGAAGYLALYRYRRDLDQIEVLAIRHQREAGYSPSI